MIYYITEAVMRDTRKNKEYFDQYIEYQNARIARSLEKLETADGVKRQRILMSLVTYEIDLLKAEFSAGASKNEIKKLLVDAIDIISDYNNFTYNDLVILLSLSIMVSEQSKISILINSQLNKIKSDRLLNCLSSYIKTKKIIWDDDLQLSGSYSKLNDVFNENSQSNQTVKLYEYLNSYYDSQNDSYWYNTHTSSNDTYTGYWSFESGAISIMLKLNTSMLKKSEYYPYF